MELGRNFLDKIEGRGTVAFNFQNIRILTVQEVAELLRVHRSTVSRYAMSGQLRSYVIGNRRLFKEEDVWLFFDNQVDRKSVAGKEH